VTFFRIVIPQNHFQFSHREELLPTYMSQAPIIIDDSDTETELITATTINRVPSTGSSSDCKHPAKKRRLACGADRGRGWSITDYQLILQQKYDPKWMRYLIVGREICPTTGREHNQSYIYSIDKLSIATVKRRLNDAGLKGVHVEAAAGDPKSNIDYCKADGKFQEFGETPPGQGARTDLHGLIGAVLAGEKDVLGILTNEPDYYHQYGRTIERAIIERERSRVSIRNWITRGIWIFGPTGTGKTRFVHEYCQRTGKSLYIWAYDNHGWCDGYNGEEVVLIDDFRAGSMPYAQLLRLLDRYPYQLLRRGKQPIHFVSKLVFITSALSPAGCYPNLAEADSIGQLERRIETTHLSSGIAGEEIWTPGKPTLD